MRTPDRFRTQLAEALVAQASEVASRPDRARRRVSQRRTVARHQRALRLALAAAAAAILAVTLLLGRGGGVAPPTASAESVLRAAANAVYRAGPALAIGHGDYLYTRVLVWWHHYEQPGVGVVRTVEETWQSRDGTGRSHARVLNRSRYDRSYGRDTRLRGLARPFLLDPFTPMSYAQLRRLPTNPTQLTTVVSSLADREGRRLGEASIAPRAAWHATFEFELLRGIAVSPVPVSVRAAAYHALATIPGIKLRGRGHDVTGRPGQVLEATLGAFRFELIVDPSTGQLLQSSRSLLRRSPQAPGWRPGLINRATYEQVEVLHSTRTPPNARG